MIIKTLNLLEVLVGLAFSIAIGVGGYRRGALSRSGVLGACITGTLIFGAGGWEWGALLLAFFFSSTALSFYRGREKERLAEKFAKGHQRDLGQTLANGGLAAVLAVCSVVWPYPAWFLACAGGLATVNADTWATELGVLSPRPPRLITTGRPVEVGTSGGITWWGSLASLAGAGFVGLIGALGYLILGRGWAGGAGLVLAATAGGLVGSLADSLLGATVQAIYWCPACQKETERVVHGCGQPTRLVRGWPWLNNDLVNFLSSIVGALVAVGIGWRFL